MSKQRVIERSPRPCITEVSITNPEGFSAGMGNGRNSSRASSEPIIIFPGSSRETETTILGEPLNTNLIGSRYIDAPGGDGHGGNNEFASAADPSSFFSRSNIVRPGPNNPSAATLIILGGIASAVILYCCYKLIKYKLGEANQYVDGALDKDVNVNNTTEQQIDPRLQGVTLDFSEQTP